MADRDNIIRMAREVGVNTSMRSIWPPTFKNSISFTPEELERLADLVIADFLQRTGQYLTNEASREAAIADAVAEEREACAKLCDREVTRWGFHAVAPSAAAGCAVLIRARGKHD